MSHPRIGESLAELQTQLSMLAWHGDETVQVEVSTWTDGSVDLCLTADGGPSVTVTLDEHTRRALIRELGGTPPPRPPGSRR
jgi:hypothetical protein